MFLTPERTTGAPAPQWRWLTPDEIERRRAMKPAESGRPQPVYIYDLPHRHLLPNARRATPRTPIAHTAAVAAKPATLHELFGFVPWHTPSRNDDDILAPGCFGGSDALDGGVFLRVDHNLEQAPLAHTGNGTLAVWNERRGLCFRARLAEVPVGIQGVSPSWLRAHSYRHGGRTYTASASLLELSLCIANPPAFAGTGVFRSLAELDRVSR